MSQTGTPRDFDFSHVSFVNSQDPSQLADLCGVQLIC